MSKPQEKRHNGECEISFLPGEYWYGIRANDGMSMPLSAQSDYEADIDPNTDCNQCNPLLVSTKGRYIWCDTGFSVTCREGRLSVRSRKAPLIEGDGLENLRQAYGEACRRHFAPAGQMPPEDFFRIPQYNTWIELMYDQNQRDVLAYAQGILDSDLPAGILMIDDGWAEDYGRWEFNRRLFPDPKGMMDHLHALGFKVMLWTCPFISPDSVEFKQLRDRGLLVRDAAGDPAIRPWWNGYSAVLDLSHPEAAAWYREKNDRLMREYGVDGFKFDAGDGSFYRDDDQTYGHVSAAEQTELWAQLGAAYPYNEFRACFKAAGLPLVQRLADKYHQWESNGVKTLIPNELLQGLLGYAYTCPDMIGGGDYLSFLNESTSLDEELFVRYAQCAALMPMMQFSAAPWRVLSEENARLCVEAALLHIRMSDRIISLARHAAETGEPIVRYMEYQFPGQGLEAITDQFMLGEDLLVAPVLQKGARTRTVRLPQGHWRYVDGTAYAGGTVTVPAPLECLPYFERID